MPYQGNGYVPPGNYGQNGSHGRAFPQTQMYGRNGQVPGYQQPPIPQSPQAQQRPQYQPQYDQSAYRARPQTQYATPQFYDQGQQASYYQSPQVTYQQLPPQRQQQPYLSPPTQTAQVPQSAQYSPDPLHYYQAPPQPHRGTPNSQGRPQPHQQAPQRTPSQQYPPQQTPSQPERSSFQGPPSSRLSFPSTPNTDPRQHNAAAAVRNSQLPPQQYQQRPSPQQQYQQRPSSQQRPHSGAGAPVSSPVPRPAPQLQQRSPPQQYAPVNSNRPPSNHSQRPPSQTSHQQDPRQQLQAKPPQVSPPGTINPSDVMPRKIAHVQLPSVQRSAPKVEESPMARAPKRRRSNEGHAVPVNDAPSALLHGSQRIRHEVPASSPLTELNSSQMPPTPTPANIDYQSVLMSLSDEYISAAYSMSGALATADVSEDDLDEYHGLLATGMGCLDSILSNYHISDARKEARIRLRFACLLYEETDNDMQAEEVLTKGISTCERARLPDLKYAMHHLLARIWFKGGKVKAAMKAVDKLVSEVEKLNFVHWIYAFRFLRVSLGLQIPNTQAETGAMVRNLIEVAERADRNHHVTVQIMASALETLIHLRSRTPESVDNAQRALATARMHQLSPEIASMPQLRVLLDFADLACHLIRFNGDQVNSKMAILQENLDALSRHPSWHKDGTWQVSFGQLPSSFNEIASDTGGMFKRLESGDCSFNFRWLTRTQVYILGFLLCALSGMHKNASHEHQAENFLVEGMKLAKQPLDPVQQSVAAASAQYGSNRLMRIVLGLYAAFAHCGRTNWSKALDGIDKVRKGMQDLESDPPEEIISLTIYLEALCKHGLGDLRGALALYQSPELKTDHHIDSKAAAGGVNPIRVLAALNSVLIMRHGGDTKGADALLSEVQNACLTNPNSNGNDYGSKSIESAFFILKATEDPYKSADNIIIKTKQYLQSAVQAAKIAVNNQLLCVVMNIMTDLFFGKTVGDQSEKSARAGRSLAKKSEDLLWTAVADDMYGNTLERIGKAHEAQAARNEAQEAMEQLPETLRTALLRDGLHEG